MSAVKESTIGVCPICEHPLIFTFAFEGAEYYCLDCGYKGGFLGGQLHHKSTPELEEQLAERKQEWDLVGPKLLSGGVHLHACRDAGGKCSEEPHLNHATQAEEMQHQWALGYLTGRRHSGRAA